MRRDRARRKTDKELERIEKKLHELYYEAGVDLRQEWIEYASEAERALESVETQYQQAVESGDKKEAERAERELEKAKFGQTLYSKKYKRLVDNTTKKLAATGAVALAYVQRQLPNVYSVSRNAVVKLSVGMGVDFTIVNERAVKNLVKAGTVTLPHKTLSIPKDMRWNRKFINSQVTQGIVRGESVQKIADRLFPEIYKKAGYPTDDALIKRCEDAAMRNARTLVNGAENLGRLDSYFELRDAGVIIRKKWLAFIDNRTRESHIEINGDEEELEDEFPNGLMYPSDPDGEPAEVYNCRCTMEPVIDGFIGEGGEVHSI